MSIGFTLPLRRSMDGGTGGYFEMSNDLMTQIKSNFINLVSTMKGERMSNPEFGCDIHKSIFSFNNTEFYPEAREAVEQAVAQWMPFIQLDQFELETTDGDKDKYRARIYMSYILIEQPNLTDEVLIQI